MGAGLRPLPLTAHAVHLCVDMQVIFSAEGPWATPWMERVLPVVEAISERFPQRTVFTRFMTPQRAEDMPGTWRRYYEAWRETTRDQLDVRLLELMPTLRRLSPPATVIDKSRYSAFFGPALLQHLHARQADALIVTGSETDVCSVRRHGPDHRRADRRRARHRRPSWRQLIMDSVSSWSETASAALPTKATTRCCSSITAASASRSKRPAPRKSWRHGAATEPPRMEQTPRHCLPPP